MPSESWQEICRKWDGIQKRLREIQENPRRDPRGRTSRPVIIKRNTNNRRSTVTRTVLYNYNITYADLLTVAYKRRLYRARCVLCWLWYHEVGMTSAQIGAVLHRDYRDVSRLIRHAHQRYQQDIHRILTGLGWGDGDTFGPSQEVNGERAERR